MSSDSVLREMQARYEIEQVLRCYARGVDRGDVALIRAAYHEDGTDDHGEFKGLGRDFAELLVASTRDRWLASQHQLHQSNIALDGETAWVETYFTAYHRVEDADGETQLETFGGRYVDRFERRVGVWAIADRVVVYDWSRIDTVANAYPSEPFEPGQRSKADLSYRRS